MTGHGRRQTKSGASAGMSAATATCPTTETPTAEVPNRYSKAIIAPPMPLAPGTHLGPYEITAPLGAGGMGEVYRARDTRLERSVAIKILPEQLSKDPTRNNDLSVKLKRSRRTVR